MAGGAQSGTLCEPPPTALCIPQVSTPSLQFRLWTHDLTLSRPEAPAWVHREPSNTPRARTTRVPQPGHNQCKEEVNLRREAGKRTP
eukprot:2240462-Rhodomonas_salina.1